MRNSLCLLMGLSFVLVLQVAFAQAATNIYIDPTSTDVAPGGSFSVNVDISTGEDIYAAEFEVLFDNSLLSADSIVEGDFLKAGASTFCATLLVNNTAGKVSYACTRFGVQTGATGTDTVATINFDATTKGISLLEFTSVSLVNPSLQTVAATTINGMVVINNPPSAINLQINPTNPKTTDNIVLGYNYTDLDGDPENGTEKKWYKNGVHQAAYDNNMAIPSSATSKGEIWNFTVRPKDGTSYGYLVESPIAIVENTIPTAPVVDVTPDNPLSTQNLFCTVTVNSTDADSDSVAYSYSWYKNNVLQPAHTTGVLSSTFTQRGETWKCVVTPNDGEENGTTAEDEETIQNLAPTIDWFIPSILNIETREGSSLFFNHSSSDPDSDPLNYWWKLDNIVQAITQAWTFSPTTTNCGNRTVQLTIGDGLLNDTQSWTVYVGLSGDVDGNNEVTIIDLASVGLAYGSSPGDGNWNENADINPGPGMDGSAEGDGDVNIFDLAMVGLNYGRSC